MPVTLRYEEHEDKQFHMTLRMTLPKKYMSGPTRDAVKLFVDHYNKKHPEQPLDHEVLHLKVVGGNHLEREARVEDFVANGDECYILGGEILPGGMPPVCPIATTKSSSSTTTSTAATTTTTPKVQADGRVRCKRFGCVHKFYDPNGPPQQCVHHKSAPIFHETAKWWSCCPDRKEYEFEAFMKVPGCQTGFCSATPEGQAGGKRVLGGCDLRADSAPVRLDADAPRDPRHKLDDLRKGLLAIGVDGALFEKVWGSLAAQSNGDMEDVCRIFRQRFAGVLGKATAG